MKLICSNVWWFQGSMERILKSLPNVDQSLTTIALTFALSGYAEDDVSTKVVIAMSTK